jgi:cytochrome P450
MRGLSDRPEAVSRSMIDTRSSVRRPPGPSDQVHPGIDPETLLTLSQTREEFGDIVSMRRHNGRFAYFINDPTEVREILTRRHSRYVKGPGFERVKMLLGNGIIVSDGDAWRLAFLASDSTRDLGVVMKSRNLRRLLLEIIEARRDASSAETYDFLSMYMHATDKRGVAFSDDELLDELITLIVAGFETSAHTLNWVWYLLAGHPDRFAEVRLPKNERPYFPLSLGPRRCLGECFSFLEMKVHIGLLLPRFRMMRVDDADPGLELGVNLRSASDIWLRPAIRTA